RRVVQRPLRRGVRPARSPDPDFRLVARGDDDQMNEKLLEVEDLEVSFATEDGLLRAVSGVSFTVSRGETVAIVGESGSGKSVTVMTLMGLTRSPNAHFAGTAWLDGEDLVSAKEE